MCLSLCIGLTCLLAGTAGGLSLTNSRIDLSLASGLKTLHIRDVQFTGPDPERQWIPLQRSIIWQSLQSTICSLLYGPSAKTIRRIMFESACGRLSRDPVPAEDLWSVSSADVEKLWYNTIDHALIQLSAGGPLQEVILVSDDTDEIGTVVQDIFPLSFAKGLWIQKGSLPHTGLRQCIKL